MSLVLPVVQILDIAPEIPPSKRVEAPHDRERNPEMPVYRRQWEQVILPVKEATVGAIGL
jgi:hypothetical protein